MFEPSEIKARVLTEDDDLIRVKDMPERMQLATSTLSSHTGLSVHTPLTPDDLNDAAMSGLAAVRIVHGKGTGALRAAVREQLTHHPLVKSYASAPPKEGGDGVTVVTLTA